ncbi:diphosphomevalonate decarboxylase [uncultured Limosilactobacillus sp.]|uniref:diphosphomevalonate decarboxylase n=1 Tax=uncultured Limosilactobacillus sp. TaxID=2837629 RepID=UPI0025E41061|nr:diphosphomevalonate decarboxylase [uncultured Limosilactobacillus sp.]
MPTTARAHTNIALVKYWGKRDPQLMLPQTDSLSLTLDRFFTDTTVTADRRLNHDRFTINGQAVDDKNTNRLTAFLDLVRQLAGTDTRFNVASTNHVPTSAGLASSASAFAALAAAASREAGCHLSRRELSRLARRGSGSATRSVYGGLVEWHRGTNDQTSFAEPLMEKVDFPLEMLAIVIDASQKKVSSRTGMQLCVETSPFYPEWRTIVESDMTNMKAAIANQDINRIGQLAQENALRMHALTLSADPGYTYFEEGTMRAMRLVDTLNANGLHCYYTMDAGPNVKLIYNSKDRQQIIDQLAPVFGKDKLIVAKPGPGVSITQL